MIRLHRNTEFGEIDAEFNTVEELEKFQRDLIKQSEMIAKEAQDIADEHLRAKAEAEEKRAEDLKNKQEALRSEFSNLIVRARDCGMSPDAVVRMITQSLEDLVSRN